MSVIQVIQDKVATAVNELYQASFDATKIPVSPTRKGIDGDYTVVVFPFSRIAKKAPPKIAQEIGEYLQENVKEVSNFSVIKGFLNLTISNLYWNQFLESVLNTDNYGYLPPNHKKVLVEFSSPNTNKPLHLGHIRNNLLGWSTAQVLKAAGYDVVTTQVINDRGVHICKSMLAWQLFGNSETPESSGLKGDHLVGKYYVIFDQKLKAEYAEWQKTEEAGQKYEAWSKGEGVAKVLKVKGPNVDLKAFYFSDVYKNKYFNNESILGRQVKEMLIKWEANDAAVRELWATMNDWVYSGFNTTYERLGVHFDKNYYESETYLLGKDKIEKGLKEGVFQQKEDGSVWIDLSAKKLDNKIVQRSDGTSVYITQDIGMIYSRYEDYQMDSMVYVVGDEQDYHFNVLFEILRQLKAPAKDGLFHLSYGMVDLPTGKMKSREGTVVDADELMDEVIEEASKGSAERGTLENLTQAQRNEILRRIGLGALKFFILKVNPRKRMVFNPEESVDLQGQTGPYIQNAFVRTAAVFRKAGGELDLSSSITYETIEPQEKDLLLLIQQLPESIKKAADTYDPSEIANYCYILAKTYHKFYHDISILKADSEAAKAFRLKLSKAVGQTLTTAFNILGIEMPEYM